MIDAKLKYQAILFANFEEITPRPDNISALLDAFRDRELIPSVFQEIGGSPIMSPRIGMNSINGEWLIQIPSRRIDIEKLPTGPRGENLGSISDFCTDAADFFARIIGIFKFKPNRISLVTNYVLEEMTPQALNGVFRKLFKPTPYYVAHEPFEWIWRTGAKDNINFSNLNERINVLTTVSRNKGEFHSPDGVAPFDRIHVLLDLNTEAESKENRFEISHIRSYYQNIVAVHDEMLKEIEDSIHE
jgi:hypothetical protein